MRNIIHFSQDFKDSKIKLGGFTRVLNQTKDGNKHFIFTVGDYFREIKNFDNNQNLTVIQFRLIKLNIFSLFFQPFVVLYLFFAIKSYLNKNKIKIDLLIAHSQLVNFYILYFLKNLKVKLIWEFNGIWGFNLKRISLKSSIRQSFQYLSQFFVIILADGFVFQTDSTRIWLQQKYKVKFKRYVVLLNSFEFEENSIPRSRKTNDLSLLVFGLLDDLNGINFLIDSLPILSKVENLKIDIYGQGNLLNKLILSTKKYDFIEYKGTFNKNELSDVMSNYNFGLIPRINCLGSNLYIPTKLVELMGNGVIPICSNVGGLTEVIENEVNGFIFESSNINSLVSTLNNISLKYDELELNKISDTAYNTINKKFSLDSFKQKQIYFLEQIINK